MNTVRLAPNRLTEPIQQTWGGGRSHKISRLKGIISQKRNLPELAWLFGNDQACVFVCCHHLEFGQVKQ
jgi:hypothetical protein